MNELENSPRDTESLDDDKVVLREEDAINTGTINLTRLINISETISPIVDCIGLEILKKCSQNSQYEVRFVGKGEEGIYKAFCLTLFQIEMKENKFYPHLNTLIKEQFYRPQIFSEYPDEEQKLIQDTCQNYFSERIDWKIQEFITRYESMIHAFIKILSSSIPTHQSIDYVLYLSKKFNIDCEPIYLNDQLPIFYNVGVKKKLHILRQCDFYLIAFDSNFKHWDLPQPQYFIESEHQISDRYQPLISEFSSENTPKFKENIDAIINRRNSHKNSFGGDHDVMNYKELVETLKKRSNNLIKRNKFISEKQEEIGLKNNSIDMKRSQIEPVTFEEQEEKNKLLASDIFKSDSYLKNNLYEMPNSFQKNDTVKLMIAIGQNQPINNPFKKNKNVQPNQIQDKKEENNDSEFLTFSEKTKIKNRKFSYLLQQKQSDFFEEGKLKKSFDAIPQAQTNKFETIPKYQKKVNSHYNFESNPISFSQLINNQELQHSTKSLFKQSQKHQGAKSQNLAIQTNTINFVKENASFQPENWIAKQTTYFFNDKAPKKFITQKRHSMAPPHLPKIDKTNIRSTIDSHQISTFSNFKQSRPKEISQTSIGNHELSHSSRIQKNVDKTNLNRDRSMTSIEGPESVPHFAGKTKNIKVTFNYSNRQRTLLNVSSAGNLNKVRQPEPLRMAFSPKASLKSFW